MSFWKYGLFAGSLMICFMSGPAIAQVKKDPRADFITILDDNNIRAFLKEVSAISTGQRPDMLDDDVINYFNNHLSDNGQFASTVKYNIPGFPATDAKLKLKKQEYINAVVHGRYLLEDYTSEIEIRELKISGNGKSATFTSIVKERGKMPIPKDPRKPDDIEMVPIDGVSTCEQRLIVSFNNFIQMAMADCQTVIDFDPFGGKPLVPQ